MPSALQAAMAAAPLGAGAEVYAAAVAAASAVAPAHWQDFNSEGLTSYQFIISKVFQFFVLRSLRAFNLIM